MISSAESKLEQSPKYVFDHILLNKKLNIQAFRKGQCQIEDDIAEHASWAFKHIYSIPYHLHKEGIARFHHGIQHVSRAALYVPMFANLYRRYGDAEALALTAEDLKLIQIAAIFHDSAREGEEKDFWDLESGIILYQYLVKVLGVEEKKALLIAEAAANKDAKNKFRGPGDKKNYFQLIKLSENEFEWKEVADTEKNIYQKLIHDADCLDIIRARDHFEGQFLDFYQEIAFTNPQALNEMAQLIVEARSLIELQGDGRRRTKADIKKIFENSEAYTKTLNMIYNSKYHHLMRILNAKNNLLSGEQLAQQLLETMSYDKTKPLDQANLIAAIREGKVFARTIPTPAGIRLKETKTDESLGALEIRKMLRRVGTPTRTIKHDRVNKNGNPDRSVSLLGWGGGIYSSVGFLVVDPDMNELTAVAAVDIDTGRHKKKLIQTSKAYNISVGNVEEKLFALKRLQKLGGASRAHGGQVSTHTELVYRLTHADAIFVSQDTNFYGDYQLSLHSLMLQAIFLQKEYERSTGIKLPIFSYSITHDFVTQIPSYTPDDIVNTWVQAGIEYMIWCNFSSHSMTCPLDDFKVQCIYRNVRNNYAKRLEAPDSNYDDNLLEQVNTALEVARKKLIVVQIELFVRKIKENEASCFEPRTYYFLERDPDFAQEVKEQIRKEIKAATLEPGFFAQIKRAWDNARNDRIFNRKPKFFEYIKMGSRLQLPEINVITDCISKHAEIEANKLLQKKDLFIFDSFLNSTGCWWVTQYSYDAVKEIIEAFKAFDLMTIYADTIKKIINKLLDDITNHCVQEFQGHSIFPYSWLIDYIDKELNLLDDAGIEKINKMVTAYGKHYAQGKFDGDLDVVRYLNLAKTGGVSLEEQKSVLIGWLTNSKMSYRIQYFQDGVIDKLKDENLYNDPELQRALKSKGVEIPELDAPATICIEEKKPAPCAIAQGVTSDLHSKNSSVALSIVTTPAIVGLEEQQLHAYEPDTQKTSDLIQNGMFGRRPAMHMMDELHHECVADDRNGCIIQ